MMKMLLSLVTAICWVGLPAGAAAQALVAVVESVKGDVDGVEFMDYVAAGQVIKLGPKGSIVLGYLKSCLRETITGGTVIVLEEQSLVQLGDVKRSKVNCDSNRSAIQPRESKQNAGNVFRSGPRDAAAAMPRLLTLYGLSPIIEVDAARGMLVIERRDKTEPRIELEITEALLVRGRFLDLTTTKIELSPGARYAATLGAASVEFKVDANAKPGATPIIGRLLRFE